MIVDVTDTLGGFDRDLRALPVRAARMQAELVKGTAQRGNRIAANFARGSAGTHGKHYHRAFTAEAEGPFTWVYGPDAARPQGGMSFEYGSRNQPPHLDLNRSADIVGATLGPNARKLIDRLYW